MEKIFIRKKKYWKKKIEKITIEKKFIGKNFIGKISTKNFSPFFQKRKIEIFKLFTYAQNHDKNIILWVYAVGNFSKNFSKIFFGKNDFKNWVKNGSKMVKNRYF